MKKKGKAFILVGRAHWGKSYTLRELTGGSRSIRHTVINGIRFFVRKMSNTDFWESFIAFIQTVTVDRLIISFSAGTPNDTGILDILKARYELFFFVLERRYGSPARTISAAEIAVFKKYSARVCVYTKTDAPASARASAFKAFVAESAA
jgi:hypothetical protein